MGDKLKSDEFIRRLREAEPELTKGLSDSDIMKQSLEAIPELGKSVELVQDRPQMKPEGSAASRFAGGLVASPVEAATAPGKAIMDAVKSGDKRQLLELINKLPKPGMPGAPMGTPGGNAWEQLPGMLDLPNIGKDIDKGDIAHSMGRATTQGAQLAALFSGVAPKGKIGAGGGAKALDTMGEIGKGVKVDAAALEAAKTLSQPVRATLDAQVKVIDDAMAGKFLDTQSLKTGSLKQAINRASKMMDQIERAPGMQVKDVSAAKEVVARLQAKAKTGSLSWKDARELYKEINNAQGTVKGASGVRQALTDISENLQTHLKDVAKTAGQGAEYDKWLTHYRDLSRWERGYAKVVKGQTAQQLEAAASATPGTRIPKTSIRIGGSDKTGKIAKQQIQTAHKALEELHGRVKQSPSGVKPPPQATPPAPAAAAPKPPAPAPPGGAAPPPPGGIPPQAGGGVPPAGGAP